MISSIDFVVFKFIFSCLSKNVISSSFGHISEQGRRNDLLIQQNVEDNTKATSDDRLSSSIIVSSDSVHCNPLTQCTVSSGLSCHTTDYLLDSLYLWGKLIAKMGKVVLK